MSHRILKDNYLDIGKKYNISRNELRSDVDIILHLYPFEPEEEFVQWTNSSSDSKG